MKFYSKDNARAQFIGPISALLMIIKNRALLDAEFGADVDFFASNDNVSAHILDLLYDPAYASLTAKMVTAISAVNPDAATILESAFAVSNNLASDQKLRSVEFMNNFMQVDMGLVHLLHKEFATLPAIYGTEIGQWYVEYANRQILKAINPISHPEPKDIFGRFGIYMYEDDLRNYVHYYGYQDYYSAYYQYGDAYNYTDASYYQYGDAYQYNEPAEAAILLRDYIQHALSSSAGLLGWKYKPGKNFTTVQLDNVVNHASKEIPVRSELLFSCTEWSKFATGTKRFLDEQLKCSLSEVSKSDKSIVPALTRVG